MRTQRRDLLIVDRVARERRRDAVLEVALSRADQPLTMK
jgi:hypothetical protein